MKINSCALFMQNSVAFFDFLFKRDYNKCIFLVKATL